MEGRNYSEQHILAANRNTKERDFWRKKLEGPLTKSSFPTDHSAAPVDRQMESCSYTVSGLLHDDIKRLMNGSAPRLFMVLLAGLIMQMRKYTGNNDIIVGAPVPKQQEPGEYVNKVQILRNTLNDNMTFKDLLQDVRRTVMEAAQHQNYPVEILPEQLNIPQPAPNEPFPLFDTAILLQDIHEKADIEPMNSNVIFCFRQLPDALEAVLEYNSRLYDKETIDRMFSHYRHQLRQAATNLDTPIRQLDPVTGEEKHLLLETFNDTAVQYPRQKKLHQLVEEQVQKDGELTAIVHNDTRFNYGELNRRSTFLARILQEEGVEPGEIVGLMMGSSPAMVTAMMAISKAGAAFMPIDPAYPADRITYMLNDSRTRTVLTTKVFKEKIIEDQLTVPVNLLDILDSFDIENPELYREYANEGKDEKDREYRPVDITSDYPAYAIYTSGSTGAPKGVLVQHNNIVNQLHGLQQRYAFEPGLQHILLAPITFDPSVQQIFLPLMSGGTLHLVSKSTRENAAELWDVIARNNMDIVNTVPSLMEILVDHAAGNKGRHFKYIILAGELFSVDLHKKLRENVTVDTLINIYGPTEATINTTLYECKQQETQIPIGTPLTNYKVLILDDKLQMQPIGVPGEICILGEGIARGYINQPELTADKFVESPHYPGLTMYRTGDTGRWLPDGNIQFTGRIDHQVKIRGIRVELGEIENQLLKNPKIQKTVVVAKESKKGYKELCAYYVAASTRPQTQLWPSVREYLEWDELLYQAMANDQIRHRSFKVAIDALVKDKVVVEIGTGQEAVFTRYCVEAGARKIYSIEIEEDSYRNASKIIKQAGMEDKITLIHGDATTVELPEKGDICISSQIGSIGSAEGAIYIHNRTRHLLKENATVIPGKCLTKIAAVQLPDQMHQKPAFSALPAVYRDKIINKFNRNFDMRLCVDYFPNENVMTTEDTFEELDFSGNIEAESNRSVYFQVNRDGRIDGFLMWINATTAEDEIIDTLKNDHCWLPVIVPVFYPGLEVSEGDMITATCSRTFNCSEFSPDYGIKGKVIKQTGEVIEFDYHSPYNDTTYKGNPFYKKLFENDILREAEDNAKQQQTTGGTAITPTELRNFLKNKLPDYMIPSYFTAIPEIPLTPNGKVDLNALPNANPAEIRKETAYAPPDSDLEKSVVAIWKDVLKLEKVGIDDNFFDLGGNSLDIVQVNAHLRQVSSKEISVVSMFKYPTIRTLSGYLAEDNGNRAPAAQTQMNRSQQMQRGEKSRNLRRQLRQRPQVR